jgi:hypothetical protein
MEYGDGPFEIDRLHRRTFRRNVNLPDAYTGDGRPAN